MGNVQMLTDSCWLLECHLYLNLQMNFPFTLILIGPQTNEAAAQGLHCFPAS
jgi:hypothetical protein